MFDKAWFLSFLGIFEPGYDIVEEMKKHVSTGLKLWTIRCFMAILAVFLLVGFSMDAYAGNNIFLTPNKTKDEKATQKLKEGKPRIFLRKEDEAAPVFVPPSPKLQSKQSPKAKVFNNNLSPYKSSDFKKLDPMKLTAAGDAPSSADELRLIAAAHRLQRTQSLIEMQKSLAPPIVVEPRYDLLKKEQQDAKGQDVEAVYEKPKTGVMPYRIFAPR